MNSLKRSHNQEGERKALTENGVHIVDVFSSDRSFVYSYKKTERVAMAAHMITDIIPDSEPLKRAVRTASLELLDAVSAVRDTVAGEREHAVSRVQDGILKMMSLLDVAFTAGSVSEMNASVLKRELRTLSDYLTEHISDTPDVGGALSQSFFTVEEGRQPEGGEGTEERSLSRSSQVARERAELSRSPDRLPASLSGAGTPRSSTESGSPEAGGKRIGRPLGYVGNVAKNERRSAIFALLKKKREITVRDCAAAVSSCSEKTLQRELLALVEEGTLKKEGERRWSRYSLAE